MLLLCNQNKLLYWIQRVPTRPMEQTVQKNAAQTVVGQTATAKTSVGFVFSVVMMGTKE